jgi:hypothetical protein
MGQRADAGEADGELAVVGVGQPDAGRFDEKAQLLGVRGSSRRAVGGRLLGKDHGLLGGDDGLFKRTVREPDAALVTARAVPPQRAGFFEGHRDIEVSGKGNPQAQG